MNVSDMEALEAAQNRKRKAKLLELTAKDDAEVLKIKAQQKKMRTKKMAAFDHQLALELEQAKKEKMLKMYQEQEAKVRALEANKPYDTESESELEVLSESDEMSELALPAPALSSAAMAPPDTPACASNGEVADPKQPKYSVGEKLQMNNGDCVEPVKITGNPTWNVGGMGLPATWVYEVNGGPGGAREWELFRDEELSGSGDCSANYLRIRKLFFDDMNKISVKHAMFLTLHEIYAKESAFEKESEREIEGGSVQQVFFDEFGDLYLRWKMNIAKGLCSYDVVEEWLNKVYKLYYKLDFSEWIGFVGINGIFHKYANAPTPKVFKTAADIDAITKKNFRRLLGPAWVRVRKLRKYVKGGQKDYKTFIEPVFWYKFPMVNPKYHLQTLNELKARVAAVYNIEWHARASN